MNTIKKGLGRGLSSLIGETKVETNTNKISLLYAYHAKLSGTTTLSGGFQFSYFERELDPNQNLNGNSFHALQKNTLKHLDLLLQLTHP